MYMVGRFGTRRRLAAQAEPIDQTLITSDVFSAQVIEQTAAFRHHGHKTATGMNVLAMGPKMVRDLPDALGQHRDLQFSGAGVRFVGSVFPDDSLLDVRVQHHVVSNLAFSIPSVRRCFSLSVQTG